MHTAILTLTLLKTALAVVVGVVRVVVVGNMP